MQVIYLFSSTWSEGKIVKIFSKKMFSYCTMLKKIHVINSAHYGKFLTRIRNKTSSCD